VLRSLGVRPAKPAEFQQIVAEAMEECVLAAGATDLEGDELILSCETTFLRIFRPAFIYVAQWIAEESGVPFDGPETAKKILREMANVAAGRVGRGRPRRGVS
jgi:hypothetical protein